ncbi:MAG: hypothetical protein C4326_03850 [Ignavibacteria bacterium]
MFSWSCSVFRDVDLSHNSRLSPLELIGVLFGLLTVYDSMKQNILTWPTGIVSVSAFGILFYSIKLYADMCLQVFFLWSCIQGWYFWQHNGKQRTPLTISRLTTHQRVWSAVAVALAIASIGFFFH